jgi:hypothetical protein
MGDLGGAFRRLVEAIERNGIPYMVGGSLASSIHGIHRYTNDIDIVAQFTHNQIFLLAKDLSADFYADGEAMLDALKRGRSFNVIHLASSYKFDFFPATNDPYSHVQLERRKVEDVVLGPDDVIRCPVATPEDIILAKLMWYRLGGEQSDSQWNDLRGVRSVQSPNLDLDYLHKWADHLKVRDLLERLMNEVPRQ